MVAPFIMVDELIYSELVEASPPATGSRCAASPYLVGLDLPAAARRRSTRIFDSVPDAYAAVKVVNAVVMSLAAVPAYLLARRVLPAGFSLFAALLAVRVPSMVYTGTVMTENAFYPRVPARRAGRSSRMLERPTPAAQLLVLAARARGTRR